MATLTAALNRLTGLLPLEPFVSEGRTHYPEIFIAYDCGEDGIYQWEVEVMALDQKLNVARRAQILEEAVQACIDHMEKAMAR